jgi:hypothetical protein
MEEVYEHRLKMEIPIFYNYVRHIKPLEKGSRPFPIPNHAYDSEYGLIVQKIKESAFNPEMQLL